MVSFKSAALMLLFICRAAVLLLVLVEVAGAKVEGAEGSREVLRTELLVPVVPVVGAAAVEIVVAALLSAVLAMLVATGNSFLVAAEEAMIDEEPVVAAVVVVVVVW